MSSSANREFPDGTRNVSLWQRLFQHASTPWTRNPAVVAAAVLIGSLATLTDLLYIQLRFGLNQPPAATGDEPDYDSIGWQLAHGNGFSIDTTNAEFRRPYDIAAERSALYQLPASDRGPVAYRPPLLPLVMAGTDFLFGRQFWAIRLIHCACMGATAGLLAAVLLRNGGWGPAICGAVLFVVLDTRSRLYARAILTEALSTLWVAILACLLLQLVRRSRYRFTVAAAVVFGLAILTRSLFILWLPGLLVLVGYLVFDREQRHPWLGPSLHMGAFLGCTFLVLLPWMFRNVRLVGRSMPLGTQGAQELSAGFSDYAWKANGEWINLHQVKFFPKVSPHTPYLQREVEQARFSKEQAFRWMRQHPLKALALMPMKVYWEFKPRTAPEALVLVLAILGAVVSWRTPHTRIGLSLVVINALAIALTWSVAGRFLVPLLFVFHLWGALAAWSLISWVTGTRIASTREA